MTDDSRHFQVSKPSDNVMSIRDWSPEEWAAWERDPKKDSADRRRAWLLRLHWHRQLLAERVAELEVIEEATETVLYNYVHGVDLEVDLELRKRVSRPDGDIYLAVRQTREALRNADDAITLLTYVNAEGYCEIAEQPLIGLRQKVRELGVTS
jgi:hypothetical protein